MDPHGRQVFHIFDIPTVSGTLAERRQVLEELTICHPVELVLPKDVKINIAAGATRGNDTPARFTLSSIDKRLLGQFAADIRGIRPPEPYKGKGIRYADEHVRRKVGKAFASGAA